MICALLVLKLIRLEMNYDIVNLYGGEYGELLKGYAIYTEFITPAPCLAQIQFLWTPMYLSPFPSFFSLYLSVPKIWYDTPNKNALLNFLMKLFFFVHISITIAYFYYQLAGIILPVNVIHKHIFMNAVSK